MEQGSVVEVVARLAKKVEEVFIIGSAKTGEKFLPEFRIVYFAKSVLVAKPFAGCSVIGTKKSICGGGGAIGVVGVDIGADYLGIVVSGIAADTVQFRVAAKLLEEPVIAQHMLHGHPSCEREGEAKQRGFSEGGDPFARVQRGDHLGEISRERARPVARIDAITPLAGDQFVELVYALNPLVFLDGKQVEHEIESLKREALKWVFFRQVEDLFVLPKHFFALSGSDQ